MDELLYQKIAFVYGACGLDTANSQTDVENNNRLDNKLKCQFDTGFLSSYDNAKESQIVLACETK